MAGWRGCNALFACAYVCVCGQMGNVDMSVCVCSRKICACCTGSMQFCAFILLCVYVCVRGAGVCLCVWLRVCMRVRMSSPVMFPACSLIDTILQENKQTVMQSPCKVKPMRPKHKKKLQNPLNEKYQNTILIKRSDPLILIIALKGLI